MEIDIKNKAENKLIFIVDSVDVSFLNALRRICTMEVPTITIEAVEIYKNNSTLFDEVLAHRLGLVPLISDLESTESILVPEECDCEDHCPRCSVSLVLKERGPKIVYSKDFSPTDPKIKPVYDTIPLLKLGEDEEVELEAIAQLGIGLEHAKWQPTTACAYRYYPLIKLDKSCEACGKCAEECPRGVLEFDEKKNKIKIVDLENCSMCKTCMSICEAGAIEVMPHEGKFIFRIETDGSLSPEEVLTSAGDILAGKSEKVVTFCKEGGS
ncbi:MAG: DNA-directed RNA polymerase subunit D [Euryarchaeota archaeon]|nr:DNA-directed RNA polymerase subunit D [Euryarchaeota archaeon]